MPSALDLTLAWTRAPWNALAFAGRRHLRWRRGAPALENEDKVRLFDDLDTEQGRTCTNREAGLRAAYGLDRLRGHSTRRDYRENLYLLDLLDRLSDARHLARGDLCAIDVGAKSWTYVTALERFFAARCSGAVELHGIEIDGHGIYPDLHSRADHARAHAAATGNPRVHYQVADFADCGLRNVDVVSMFFPFVTRYALLRWGLPVHLFRPEALFAKAVEVLRPGGVMVVLNQTADEKARTLQLAGRAGAELVREMFAASCLPLHRTATQDRWATLWRKAGTG